MKKYSMTVYKNQVKSLPKYEIKIEGVLLRYRLVGYRKRLYINRKTLFDMPSVCC